MKKKWRFVCITILCLSIIGCGGIKEDNKAGILVQESNPGQIQVQKKGDMVWVPGGEFTMGTNAEESYPQERPAVRKKVNPFWIDESEVTNREFSEFVKATGYKTVAERKPDWEEMKKLVPPGTPKPPEEMLVPGSLVFVAPEGEMDVSDISQWWKWVKGASWKHPEGPGSDLEGRWNHPVVHIAYEDAQTYAKWAGKRLPTEEEWEFASKGGKDNRIYAWGDTFKPHNQHMANTFQGKFPFGNKPEDGFLGTSPVKQYLPNEFGVYDMIGNVWELTDTWYDALAFKRAVKKDLLHDSNITQCYNPYNEFAVEKVVKGGSFLCSDNYCVNYRPSARQGQDIYSGTSNIGFRCVVSAK